MPVFEKCEWCGKATEKKPGHVMAHNFCSRGCSGLWRRGRKFHSEETKRRLSEMNAGKKCPEQAERMRRRRGPLHPRWVGDDSANPMHTGHTRAEAWFPIRACSRCGAGPAEKRIMRHHKDRNPLNNASDNIEMLCGKCHKHAHEELRGGE